MWELTGVEVLWRYDWIAYREDENWNRFSRWSKVPIDNDELCRPWLICKVEQVWEWDYKILSKREDKLALEI